MQTLCTRPHGFCRSARPSLQAALKPRDSSVKIARSAGVCAASEGDVQPESIGRRSSLLLAGLAAAACGQSGPALAIQGYTAGRIPGEPSRRAAGGCSVQGQHRQYSVLRCRALADTLPPPSPAAAAAATALLRTPKSRVSLPCLPSRPAAAGISSTPDADGLYAYVRPEGKSGGHGVGWSEVPQYSFKVPAGWEETPVSIADLGGTEVISPLSRARGISLSALGAAGSHDRRRQRGRAGSPPRGTRGVVVGKPAGLSAPLDGASFAARRPARRCALCSPVVGHRVWLRRAPPRCALPSPFPFLLS